MSFFEQKGTPKKVEPEIIKRQKEITKAFKTVESDAWTAKYRPKTLDEVIGQEKAVAFFKRFIERPQECPNFLLYGPSGTGKTTIAIAFLKSLFKKNYSDAVLELNASDSRTLEDVRTKIKVKAQTYPPVGVPFNVIFLDEVDEMAPKSQPALRRIIEGSVATLNPRRCRFILSCNRRSKVIDPIQSRCTPFFIRPLPPAEVIKCLTKISLEEKVSINPDALEIIAIRSRGDLRKSINQLQVISTLNEGTITKIQVTETLNVPDSSTVFEILNLTLNGKFSEACAKARSIAYTKGFTSQSVIEEMSLQLFRLPIQDESVRAQIAEALAEYEVKAYMSGVNKDVLLNGILGRIYLLKGVKLETVITKEIPALVPFQKPKKEDEQKKLDSLDLSIIIEEELQDVEELTVENESGLLLATLYCTGKNIKIVPSSKIKFNVNTPPFRTFFENRILEPFRMRDTSKQFSYVIIADEGILEEILIKNLYSKFQLREIRSAIRWVLKNMRSYQETHKEK